jgi:hypothetical protein
MSDLQGSFKRIAAGDIFGGVGTAYGWIPGSDLDARLLDARRLLDAAKEPAR